MNHEKFWNEPNLNTTKTKRQHYVPLSTATGAATMGLFIGAALGPWLGGLIFDTTGRYLWALLLAMGVSIVAFIIALRIPSAIREI